MKNKNKSYPYKKLSVFYNSCLKTLGSHLVLLLPSYTSQYIVFVHIITPFVHLSIYRVRTYNYSLRTPLNISCSYILLLRSYTSQYIVFVHIITPFVHLSIYRVRTYYYTARTSLNISCWHICQCITHTHTHTHKYTTTTAHQQTHTGPRLPFTTNVDSA